MSTLIDDLKKFYGLPPYHGTSNPCVGDGYFGASLIDKYGKDAVEEATKTVIIPLQEKFKRAIDSL